MPWRCIAIDQFAYFAGCPIVLPSAKASRGIPAKGLITFLKQGLAMVWHRPCFCGGRFRKDRIQPLIRNSPAAQFDEDRTTCEARNVEANLQSDTQTPGRRSVKKIEAIIKP